MTRYTITLDIEGPDEGELEDVLDRLLDAGTIQDVIVEAVDDRGLDAVITNAKCDAGVEDPEEEEG